MERELIDEQNADMYGTVMKSEWDKYNAKYKNKIKFAPYQIPSKVAVFEGKNQISVPFFKMYGTTDHIQKAFDYIKGRHHMAKVITEAGDAEKYPELVRPGNYEVVAITEEAYENGYQAYANGGYLNYINDLLTKNGFDIAKLTQYQKELIVMPTMEPENYHMDGEITLAQATSIWLRKLADAGFGRKDITKSVKMNFAKAADGSKIGGFKDYTVEVIGKELEKDGGHKHRWVKMITAKSEQDAVRIARENFNEDWKLSDISFFSAKVIDPTEMDVVQKRGVKMAANGMETEKSYQIHDKVKDTYFSMGMDGKYKWYPSPDMGYTYTADEAERLKDLLISSGYPNLEVVKYNKDWWKTASDGAEVKLIADIEREGVVSSKFGDRIMQSVVYQYGSKIYQIVTKSDGEKVIYDITPDESFIDEDDFNDFMPSRYKKGGMAANGYNVKYPSARVIEESSKEDTVREIKLKLKDVKIPTVLVENSQVVVDFLKKVWDLDAINIQEEFCVLYLNRQNRIISYQKLSKGGISNVIADVEMIVATASKALATGVIIAHNHPSGNVMPSQSDKDLTKNLKSALKLIDVILVDSIIITAKDNYYSFVDQGILSEGGLVEYGDGGGIPERYKDMGFTKVGQKKKSTRPGKKWMVLAKKGDEYKVVHGGYEGMQDYSQHHDDVRRKRFWTRMGGINSKQANDPFSPLYWHKKFGTWEDGGGL